MKWVTYFLIVILSINYAYAESISGTYNEGETVTVSGRNIEIERISEEEAIILIDGNSVFLKADREDLKFGVLSKMSEPRFSKTGKSYARFEFTTYATCGDGVCDSKYENANICCRDCKCRNENFLCIDNYCIDPKTSECIYDKDCKGEFLNYTCVGRKCAGTPRKCIYWEVKEAGPKDGCCIPGTEAKKDPDCYECELDRECDDKDECTKDRCEEYVCTHSPKGCKLENGTCFRFEDTFEEKFCDPEDGTFKELKEIGEKCRKKHECKSDFCHDYTCADKDLVLGTGKKKAVEKKEEVKEEEKEKTNITAEQKETKPNIFTRFWSWLTSLFSQTFQ
ncbi:MAG: hypothetical protein QW331_03120 [Candidatus Woesearchaeota archaeon]